uniref:LIM zinc-binding domain-containing protein n=1 Tax=Apteryx owenii TaxID=8824 RepID=A0A8B9P531_APTOW
MERVVSDKVCLHRSCFCCQICRRKLSLQNYAALHGVFYCQLHYKQMAEVKSRRETGRLEHQLVDHQKSLSGDTRTKSLKKSNLR